MGERGINRGAGKHRFPIRIDTKLFEDINVDCFRRKISVNLMICEMIRFANKNATFRNFIEKEYPVKYRQIYDYIDAGEGRR